MSKKKKWIYNSKIAAKAVSIAAGFLYLFLLAGCGSQDKAIVLLGQENRQEIKESETEPEDGLSASSTDDSAGSMEVAGELSERSADVREMIYVHVCGAVVSPGVVELPRGSRVETALLAAGGFAESAAEDYVNLASKVEDGQQLYFPTIEEVEALLSGNGGLLSGMESGKQGGQDAAQESGKVNINTADVSLLCTLPGIGEARAQDIITYREEHGAFQRIEDIMQVSGIKQSAFEKISDRIMVR
ncbi:MAG: helix-hairpin-helix domain-containing protein [Lachnospiraceae bacterium]|nr:helix-hairpin-helix domain-containing protein [Lachnospiraceae bacterium]